MGKGVTNPVGGAASSSTHSTSAEDTVASLLHDSDTATCFELVLLFGLAFALLRWFTSRGKILSRYCSKQLHVTRAKVDISGRNVFPGDVFGTLNTTDTVAVSGITELLTYTDPTSHGAPRLRRSTVAKEKGNVVSSFNEAPVITIQATNAKLEGKSDISSVMDSSKDSLPEPQSDSFFTWDSGGSSGEYSFVHTAVELPKYPENAITEEERQMLLLYMQTGHPELLLTSSSLNPPTAIITASDNMPCDPIAVRGFLETIVEENSDDLKSPSECDETSLGWGSWDESDDDRVTVVEMQTSGINENSSYTSPNLSFVDRTDGTDKKLNLLLTCDSSSSTSKTSVTPLDNTIENNQVTNYFNQYPTPVRDAGETHSDLLVRETKESNLLDCQYKGSSEASCADTVAIVMEKSDNLCEPFNMDTIPNETEEKCIPVVSPSLNSLDIRSNDFDELWISVNKLDSPSDTSMPWNVNNDCNIDLLSKTETTKPVSDIDLLMHNQLISGENSLLTLGSEDDLCLVPSNFNTNFSEHNFESLVFSDDFKDYFLPTKSSTFKKDEMNNDTLLITENVSVSSQDKNMRCFRIGFDDENLITIEQNTDTTIENVVKTSGTQENIISSSDSEGETMFSPLNGDIAYSSSWLIDSEPKPEKIASGTETSCSTNTMNVRCTPSTQFESPSVDKNRKLISEFEQCASDDDIQDVPTSLSRWQHHSDLQHVQEATSPLTRWQHQTNLQILCNSESDDMKCKQTISDDSDDGLPSHLKELYNSFKMKGKKSRIRIKDEKLTNFNALGLWDCETKVTLPPFTNSVSESEKLPNLKLSEQINAKEDLDDLEFDMFTVTKNNEKPSVSNDSDIDDALRSFNHLNDYSSNSDEQSEAELDLTVNVKDNNSDTVNILNNAEISTKFDVPSPIVASEAEAHSLENPCSDNSDNCPLCKEANFKKSELRDLFAEQISQEHVESLLLNTYPKMTRLSEDNLTDVESKSNFSGNSSKDLTSPMSSSDSDEGIRGVKEVKKRVKKRNKDNQSTELKHDDSGYVEDDDDDDDDILVEKKSSKSVSSNENLGENSESVHNFRKSLSTVFYESKSNQPTCSKHDSSTYLIPPTFQEFSKQLEQSMNSEEFKSGILQGEKWAIPENLSQFSAWLLDKELMEINCREEIEKMLVNDVKTLREQTIAQFLKKSISDESAPPDLIQTSSNIENLIYNLNSISFKNQNDDLKHVSQSQCNENTPIENVNTNNDFTMNNSLNGIKTDISSIILPEIIEINDLKLKPNNENQSEQTKTNSIHKIEVNEHNQNDKVCVPEKTICESKSVMVEKEMFNLTNNEDTLFKNRNSVENDAPNILLNLETEKHSNLSLNSKQTFSNSYDPNLTSNISSINEKMEDFEISFNKSSSDEDRSKTEFINESNGLKQQADDNVHEILHEPIAVLQQSTSETQYKVGSTTTQRNANEVTVTTNLPNEMNGDEVNENGNYLRSLETAKDMAPPIEEKEILSNTETGSASSRDPMTCGEEKGALEGCDREADDVLSPQATSVKSEVVEDTTHVFPDSSHASCEPCLSVNAETNSNVLIAGEASEKYSVGDISRGEGNREFGEVINGIKVQGLTTISQDYTSEASFALSCSDKITKEIPLIETSQKTDIAFSDIGAPESRQDNLLNRSVCSESVIDTEKASNSENLESSVRIEYKRSNSLGRNSSDQDDTLDSTPVQSKSTPDLRNCHEQHSYSSSPLSARLSKSVCQRIQDYLGHSSRGGALNRSLPPHERSRHYHRICVSTETVVERAARFEARSRSISETRKNLSDSSHIKSRSGSCPVSNMRNFDRYSRAYNKPTAAVKPTIGNRGTMYGDVLNGKIQPDVVEKEDFLEMITGYSKATKVTHKPPVAPVNPNSHQMLKSNRLKGKIASARKDFFERLSQQDLSSAPNETDVEEDLTSDTHGLQRFDAFRRSAREERARLAASHPDLGALEAAVRSSKRKIDQLKKKKKSGAQGSPAPLDAGPSQQSSMPSTTTKEGTLCLPYRRCTGEIAWASCAKRLEEAKSKSKPNLAQEQLEIVDRSSFWFKRPAETKGVRAHRPGTDDDYYEEDSASSNGGGDSAIAGAVVVENCDFLGTRAKSMDFLLDADNRDKVQPPENRLAAGQGRVKSEHELRIERSLQNLTIPDWYKQSAWSKKPKEGFILRRGSEGSAGESRKRWQGFSTSRTPSATSLTTPASTYSNRNIIVPKRVTPTTNEWRYVGSLVSSRESLTPASPSSLSPRECASAAFQYGLSSSLSRWSSSRLSTSSAPLTTLSVHRSFRQPYLGWRAAAASSGYTPSSGGGSRSSPGISPVTATTPLQGSRPTSPRRGSQEHHFVYGLHQNQITSAATLRPDGSEATDSSNRISPLALNTTNVFFNSNVELSHSDSHPYEQQQQRYGSAEMRRDRYSYTQSLYSGTVIMSPGTMDDDRRNFNVDQVPRIIASLEEDVATNPSDQRFSLVKSPQPPPRLWMESSFVGTKQDGSEPPQTVTRSIRIVPSDSVRPGMSTSARSSTSSLRGTCATQTAMDTRELIDHLHNFLRGLQNRNQVLRPSSTSAFTPVPSSSNSGFHEATADDSDGSHTVPLHLNRDQRPNLVDYETEPKAYPRGSWRHSSSSSKDISPDNSSTDNEMWLSVGEDMGHKGFRRNPEHLDGRSSSRSSISPPSPSSGYPSEQKRVSGDSTGSARPIFFASSRRGSKGSNQDTKPETSPYHPHQQHMPSNTSDYSHQQSSAKEEFSRKSSSTHSDESGFIRRDSKSGGSSSWRDSKTDQESSSAATSRGEKDSKSSASMEEVLESLLAIPPISSRSSSPTSPRRSKVYGFQQEPHRAHLQGEQERQPTTQGIQQQLDQQESDALSRSKSMSSRTNFPHSSDNQWAASDSRGLENIADDLGKMLDDSLKFPPPFPISSTTATQLLPISSPMDEVNHGSFCPSSSTSPLEDDVQSPTSMEVLVPEGEEQELFSIIEDDTKLEEECKYKDEEPHRALHEQQLQQREQSPRPPLQRQAMLPSCSSADLLSQQPQHDTYTNLFAGLQPGSYSRGMAEGSLRRPQSLCLVLLHLPCMFCARALAPPPHINSFSNGPTRMTCVSEPTTPVRELTCPSSYESGSCFGQPENRVIENPYDPYLTNLGSNPGRGPSVNTTATIDDKGTPQEATPTKKKKPSRGIPGTITATEGHLKCHRPKCTKSLPVEEARAKFRTCPNCYTYYCSRQCRKLHLARHKEHCPQTRISNLCKQVLMKARDDPVSRRHLSLCAKRGLLSRGRGAVKLLFLNPEDALDYLVHGWESAKGQTLYVSRSDLLPQEMGSDVFSQVRNFCDKYNPERKFILLAAITVTNEIAAALEREVVVRGAKLHLSPSLPEDDVQTLILTITKTDPETGDPAQTTVEDRKHGLSIVEEQLSARGVDLEKLYPHTYRKILRFVNENEPFTPISIFPTDQRNGRVFMCIILPWADADIIVNISTKGGASIGKTSKRKWPL